MPRRAIWFSTEQLTLVLTTYQFRPDAVDDLTFGVMKVPF